MIASGTSAEAAEKRVATVLHAAFRAASSLLEMIFKMQSSWQLVCSHCRRFDRNRICDSFVSGFLVELPD